MLMKPKAPCTSSARQTPLDHPSHLSIVHKISSSLIDIDRACSKCPFREMPFRGRQFPTHPQENIKIGRDRRSCALLAFSARTARCRSGRLTLASRLDLANAYTYHILIFAKSLWKQRVGYSPNWGGSPVTGLHATPISNRTCTEMPLAFKVQRRTPVLTRMIDPPLHLLSCQHTALGCMRLLVIRSSATSLNRLLQIITKISCHPLPRITDMRALNQAFRCGVESRGSLRLRLRALRTLIYQVL